MKRFLLILAALYLPSHASQKPNILLILADDMGYSDLGSFGSGIETPHLDKLAEEGITFTRFLNTGRCCPTRAAILTGHYPHQAGVGHMLGKTKFPAYSDGLNPKLPTLPEILRSTGYHTFMSGKWHLGWKDADSPNARGFDRFYGARGYVDSYYDVVNATDVYLDKTIVNKAGEKPVNQLHPDREFYTTDTYTDYAIHFIDAHLEQSPDKPFFGYIAHNAPHFPLHAKPEDTKKYQGSFLKGGFEEQRRKRFEALLKSGIIPSHTQLPEPDYPDWNTLSETQRIDLDFTYALYCAIIDRLDQNIGRLVEHLRSKGILENTIIVFLSDNGSTKERTMFGMGPAQNLANYKNWGRKGGWTSSLGMAWANVANTPFRQYKRGSHFGGTATPCIVRAGADTNLISQKGKHTRQIAHVIDLLPTFTTLAGKADVTSEGISLIPSLRDFSKNEPRTLFWEHEGNRAILDGSWKLVADHNKPWTLHHIEKDPTEIHDLAATESNLTDKLKKQWSAWADRVGVVPWPQQIESKKPRQKNQN